MTLLQKRCARIRYTFNFVSSTVSFSSPALSFTCPGRAPIKRCMRPENHLVCVCVCVTALVPSFFPSQRLECRGIRKIPLVPFYLCLFFFLSIFLNLFFFYFTSRSRVVSVMQSAESRLRVGRNTLEN